MRNNIEQLNQILTLEEVNYESLKEIEADKTEVFIQGDVNKLFALLKDQEDLAASLQTLQKKRLELQMACAEEKGIDKKSTLGDLIKVLDANEESETLIKLRQKVLDLAKELSRLVRNNEVLIHQNLDHIKDVFNIVSGQSLKLSYGEKGESTNLGKRIIMDKTA